MRYKRIVLDLLQDQYPKLHEQLRAHRQLLQAVNDYATALRTAHLTWMDEFRQANPGLDPLRISREALEMALQDLRESLPSGSATDEDALLSLVAAMTSLRRATPPA
jgi:hypothetical protein